MEEPWGGASVSSVELSDNDAFKAQWKTALSFTNTKHAMNGTAAADPTL